MKEIVMPSFVQNIQENRINESARIFVFSDQTEEGFSAYCTRLEKNGYTKKEERRGSLYRYASFQKESSSLFLNFFSNIREMTLVQEENSPYFSYRDVCGEVCTVPQITQLALSDFGMSYVIGLSDGRLMVIDGGREFPQDAENLYQTLCSVSPLSKPVIAAWILTHPHSDHFHCFHVFMKRFGEQITLEKVFLNFPDADDLDHFPALAPSSPEEEALSPQANIPLMWNEIKKAGAEVYTPHTGQSYRVGDALIEILGAMDDILHRSQIINASSLVFRMELGGQVILWTGDVSSSFSRLGERYGNDLKADILQVPHHGFQSGKAAGEILLYDHVRPQVCLLPVADHEAYVSFCPYRKGTKYLLTHPDVKEVITGTPQRTIPLPYTPPTEKKAEIERNLENGKKKAGAQTWIFSDLSTASPEDLVFTLLNTTYVAANVRIDLYFDSIKKRMNWQTTTGRVSFIPLSLEQSFREATGKDLPKNEAFSIRFTSDIPIVVSNKKNKPAFYSSENL